MSTPGAAQSAVRTPSHTQTFTYTGGEQKFKVPTDVTSIKIVADGAAADTSKGGRTEATVAVTPGETLHVFVGGEGAFSTGGFNGGAIGCHRSDGQSWGGGGATDIRQGGDGLGNRIVIAGGGGGRGFNKSHGGPGGGPTGGTGKGPPRGKHGQGGGGGTQTQGGAGGVGGDARGSPGSPGALGVGGAGGGNSGSGSHMPNCGGGGGGGYYGGGGGGSGSLNDGSGGGGGGGSSYAESSAKDVQLLQDWRSDTGNGQITLTW